MSGRRTPGKTEERAAGIDSSGAAEGASGADPRTDTTASDSPGTTATTEGGGQTQGGGAAASGGAAAVGSPPSGLNEEIERRAREIADEARRARQRAYYARRKARERGEAPPAEGNPASSSGQESADFLTAVETVSKKPPRVYHKADLRQTAEEANLIAQSLSLMVNGFGMFVAGESGKMTPSEEENIVLPLTRIISKMQPDTIKALQAISDPAVLALGVISYGSRLVAIRRDQSRGSGRPPTAPIGNPGGGGGVGATSPPLNTTPDNGRVVNITTPTPNAYSGSSLL